MAKWAREKKKQREEEQMQRLKQAAESFRQEFERYGKWNTKAFGHCMLCLRTFEPYAELKDACARLEYLISLTCQQCQDLCFRSSDLPGDNISSRSSGEGKDGIESSSAENLAEADCSNDVEREP